MLACLDGRVVFFADVVFLTEAGFLGVALAGTHFGVALATLRFGVAFAAVRFEVALAALHLGVAARLGVAFTAFHLGEALPESLLLLGSVTYLPSVCHLPSPVTWLLLAWASRLVGGALSLLSRWPRPL